MCSASDIHTSRASMAFAVEVGAISEVWLLDLPADANCLDSCQWSFPSEPPSARPFVGRLGAVANPRSEESPDEDKRAQARLLREWREDETTWMSLQDMPAAKRQRLALTPRREERVNRLIRKAQNSGVTPLKDRAAPLSP